MTLENLKWLEFKVKTLRFGLNLEEEFASWYSYQ